MTPNEAFYGKKPSVSTLRIFDSRCHVRTPPEHRRKLNAHSIDEVLCGFERGSKAYKVWIPSKHKFIVSQDVIVYEKVFSHTTDSDNIASPNTTLSEGVPSAPLSTAQIEGVILTNTNLTTTMDSTPVAPLAAPTLSDQPDTTPIPTLAPKPCRSK